MELARLQRIAHGLHRVKHDPPPLGLNELTELENELGIAAIVNAPEAEQMAAAFAFEKPAETDAEAGPALFLQFISKRCKIVPHTADLGAALQRGGKLYDVVAAWKKGDRVDLPAIIDLACDDFVRAPKIETVQEDEPSRLLLAPPTSGPPNSLANAHSAQYRLCMRALSFVERQIEAGAGATFEALCKDLHEVEAGLARSVIPEAEWERGEKGAVTLVDAVTLMLLHDTSNGTRAVSEQDVAQVRVDASRALFTLASDQTVTFPQTR